MTTSFAGPLADSAAHVRAVVEGLALHAGAAAHTLLRTEPGWTRCSEVDAAHLAGWEAATAAALPGWYGAGADPTTASAHVLHWYAAVAATAAAALFRHARRVPRLDRAAVAFRCPAGTLIPDATALLDDRFWCLPADPDAGHPDATVVTDEAALAAVLRAQVRAHAEDFLAGYVPSARLPRRARLGAFFDALDTGVWRGADGTTACAGPAEAGALLAEAALVLPGRTPEFADATTLQPFHDDRDRLWVTRRRVSCCFYYRVSPDGSACSTCPRTGARERARRYAELVD
jgi:hypothetical protein